MDANSLSGADNFVLQAALGAYSDEAYTNARKLSSTGIVGPNPQINTDTETYIGQMRWFKPMTAVINVASLTSSSAGSGQTYTSDYATYIKTVRTHGATQVNLQHIITQQDGLAKVSRDFGETRAQDEHNAILSVLKGVAIAELLYGAGKASGSNGLGGQTFENDPTSKRYGFYVDLGSSAPVVAADYTTGKMGAARAEGFLNAIGMGFKDYEPDWMYLVTSPAVLASLRSANLVDETKITEGNVTFDTIFGGKFRLIQTRANQTLSSAQFTKLNTGPGIDIAGTKTSFLVTPGALAMAALSVQTPVEIFRDGRAYKGGGSTDIWYRWGYVLHPQGYDWAGAKDAFSADCDYMKVIEDAVPVDLTSATNGLVTGTPAYVQGVWQRKTASALSLGILPIFHS